MTSEDSVAGWLVVRGEARYKACRLLLTDPPDYEAAALEAATAAMANRKLEEIAEKEEIADKTD